MRPLTREQRLAIKRVYERVTDKGKGDGSPSYLAFRRRVKGPFYHNDPVIMLHWAGMWLGIERDGYTHS